MPPESGPNNSAITHNVETIVGLETADHRNRTLGERIADGFAAVVGSWTFIIIQSGLLLAWIALNVAQLVSPWDPYPFILLNLALSFQAAYATPIIMMSQNRQSRIADRRNHLDLQINLLAEQESTETLRLLRRLCQHLEVNVAEQSGAEALETDVNPAQLANQLDAAVKEMERKSPDISPSADPQ